MNVFRDIYDFFYSFKSIYMSLESSPPTCTYISSINLK